MCCNSVISIHNKYFNKYISQYDTPQLYILVKTYWGWWMGLSPWIYKSLTYGVGGILIGRGKEGCSILPYFFSIGNPLVRQISKFDFHQAVIELLLLVLYKFHIQRLSGTTLFISMDYSYNPTSEPLLLLVWLTWWVLHLIISGLNSIPLSLMKIIIRKIQMSSLMDYITSIIWIVFKWSKNCFNRAMKTPVNTGV